MTNKLSDSERNRVSDILTKCAQATKHIDDSKQLGDAVFELLSKELGDRPGLFKAACQTYNSCKSIYRLEACNDDTRGNSFAILDVQDMMRRLDDANNSQMRKSAAAPATFKKNQPVDIQPIFKEAGERVDSKHGDSPENVSVSEDTIRRYIKSELDDLELSIHKSASSVRVAGNILDSKLGEFIHDLTGMSTPDRARALSKIAANFDGYGKALLKVFEDTRPDKKVSDLDYFTNYKGTPSLPKESIYKKAKEAVDAIKDFSNAKIRDSFLLLRGADALKSYCKIYKPELRKVAATSPLLGAVVKADAAKEIAEMFSLSPTDTDKLTKDIYNSEYMNELIGHSYGRAFMNALMDDSISKYPLTKLVNAFNSAVAKLPVTTRTAPATVNQALINSLMINALATGSAPSKADTDTIEALQSAYKNIDIDRGFISNNNINR